MSEEEVKKSLQHLTVSTDYSDLAGCDIIIEAIAEDITLKKEVFKESCKRMQTICNSLHKFFFTFNR